jgi:hypothetical protein
MLHLVYNEDVCLVAPVVGGLSIPHGALTRLWLCQRLPCGLALGLALLLPFAIPGLLTRGRQLPGPAQREPRRASHDDIRCDAALHASQEAPCDATDNSGIVRSDDKVIRETYAVTTVPWRSAAVGRPGGRPMRTWCLDEASGG